MWRFFKKLKIELPYDPVIPLLDIYPEKTKRSSERHMQPRFMAALLTIAKAWKHPKGPLTDEWIKKKWCIYMQWNITQP